MNEKLKLMAVLAHPDDETLGLGGVLAKYAAEGVETHLLTATRGEVGWPGPPGDYPGEQALAQLRAQELSEASLKLGVTSYAFLNYVDGQLDQADPTEVTAKIARHVRRIRPEVVVTFGPDGLYGHPDHIAISQFTAAGVMRAADPGFHTPGDLDPHAVSKLYYLVGNQEEMEIYQQVFGDLVMMVDGQERRSASWPGWTMTTIVDTRRYRSAVWAAVDCHRTQLSSSAILQNLSPAARERLWQEQYFYRVFSLVNGGRALEQDLFEGLTEVQNPVV